MKRFDVIIVGCGAYGSAVSYYLSKLGLKTLTLEKFQLNHSNGSSHGKTRIIRTAYAEDPSYVPLVKRARELWFELQRASGAKIIKMTGGLQIGSPDGELITGVLASVRRHHLGYNLLSYRQVRDYFPIFHLDKDQVGVFEQDAGVLFPENCIRTFVELARESGGIFKFQSPVADWRVQPDRNIVVSTCREEYNTESLVLSIGSWLPGLTPDLNLPLSIERQTMFWMKPRVRGAIKQLEESPIFLFENRDVSKVRKEKSSRTRESPSLFYGTPDFGDGFKVGEHHTGEYVSSPTKIRRRVTKKDAERVKTFVSRRIPDASGGIRSSSVCIYTNSQDYNFVIDSHPRLDNVTIVSACSGHGFKFASSIGESIAQKIAGKKSAFNLSWFGLRRFRRHKPNS